MTTLCSPTKSECLWARRAAGCKARQPKWLSFASHSRRGLLMLLHCSAFAPRGLAEQRGPMQREVITVSDCLAAVYRPPV